MTARLKVLDLFAGLRGWSDPWKARGHEVITLDNEEQFGSDLTMDIREFAKDPKAWLPWDYADVVLASPPCEAFSVMTIGRNWTREHEPKTDKARLALELVWATRDVIEALDPIVWVIENPRAKLRKLEPVKGLDRVTVTYCQYGEPYMKPTDLWGGFPPRWEPRPVCKPGADCHISAARGSRTGIQGSSSLERLLEDAPDDIAESIRRMAAKDGTDRTKFRGGMIEVMARFPSWSEERKVLTALRARIPRALSEELCIATETYIADTLASACCPYGSEEHEHMLMEMEARGEI